jgi:hypothetical protein
LTSEEFPNIRDGKQQHADGATLALIC